MRIYWLEVNKAEVPLSDEWLSEDEQVRLNGLRFPKRRADWRLGRWTAKRAIASFLGTRDATTDLAKLEIRPAPSGAPRAFIEGEPARISMSLTHSNGTAACAVASVETVVGCDLEKTEARTDGFVADYFTDKEQDYLHSVSVFHRPRFVNLIWSAKESAMKALEEGLRLDTRSLYVEVTTTPNHDDSWHPLRVYAGNDGIFNGWYQFSSADQVRTIVAIPAPDPPIFLAPVTQV